MDFVGIAGSIGNIIAAMFEYARDMISEGIRASVAAAQAGGVRLRSPLLARSPKLGRYK